MDNRLTLPTMHTLTRWLHQLPVPWERRPLPAPLPSRRRATLPPSHDIPLGFQLREEKSRLQEVLLRYKPQRAKSLITIVPSRGGKTTCQLGMELANYGGEIDGVAPSVVVNDKKGELVAIAGRARALLGDTVLKIDPFDVAGRLSPWVQDTGWNPLEGITPASDTFESDVLAIADGLMVQHSNADPHWTERARQGIAAILGHLCDDSNNEPAALPYLMTVFGLPDTAFKAYMQRLAEESPLPCVRHLAGAFTADTDEISSIVSSAVGQLGFLLNRKIAKVFQGKTFRWDDLKQGGVSLFFCLPEAESVRYARFSRLFWSSCINSLYRFPVHPVLAIIDEASNSLAGQTLEIFEHAFSLGAGFGLRLHLLFQNVPQFRSLFKEQTDSVVSATGVMQFFRPNDLTTAKFIAERAGRRTHTIVQKNVSVSVNYGQQGVQTSGTNTSFSLQHYDRPKWTEQQLFEMSPHKQVLFFEGIGAPVIALRKPYWSTQWADRFDPNPYAPQGR